MRMVKAAAMLAALLLLAATALASSPSAQGSLDPYFTIDWKVVPGARGETIEGFVYNKSNHPTERMLLGIEALDGAGQVIGRSSTWVLGGVLPNNRGWFTAPVPAAGAAGYRIEIKSFDWAGPGT